MEVVVAVDAATMTLQDICRFMAVEVVAETTTME